MCFFGVERKTNGISKTQRSQPSIMLSGLKLIYIYYSFHCFKLLIIHYVIFFRILFFSLEIGRIYIHYSLIETVKFFIPNVRTLYIPYSFSFLSCYSLSASIPEYDAALIQRLKFSSQKQRFITECESLFVLFSVIAFLQSQDSPRSQEKAKISNFANCITRFWSNSHFRLLSAAEVRAGGVGYSLLRSQEIFSAGCHNRETINQRVIITLHLPSKIFEGLLSFQLLYQQQ